MIFNTCGYDTTETYPIKPTDCGGLKICYLPEKA